MRKLLVYFIALFMGIGSVAAQEKVKEGVKEGGKKVGHKTAEVASKSKAKVTDQKYKGKTGPNGQTVYIDNHSRYYWIDKKGRKHYMTEAQLKNKID